MISSSRRGFKPSTSASGENLGRQHRPDYFLVLGIFMLLALGLVVIYSVSPALAAQLKDDVDPNHFMYRQLFYLMLGFVTFGLTSFLPLSIWRKLYPTIITLAVISFFLLLIPALSLNYGGATRWVHIGPITYQPAEVLKFGLIFYLAYSLSQRIKNKEINNLKVLKWFLVILGLIGLEVVILQKDLGTMIPIVAIMLTMYYVSGVSKKRITQALLIIFAAGLLSVVAAPHRMARVFTFLNPEADSKGSGYHINQALLAVGSGGVTGKGLGRSVQAYGYLPEAANDSIFAIMAEKFGFVGMMAVFSIYGALLLRLIAITARAPNNYLRLIAAGVFAWMCVQAFVNVGAMLGIMPLTGVTLPLLSFGGTSLVFTLAALGIVFNISRYTKLGHLSDEKEGGSHAYSTRRGRLGRPRHAT